MHPDFETNVTLQDAGLPRPPGTFSSTSRRACSAIRTRSRNAARSTSPSSAAPPISQAGVITVRGNYEGIQDNLLGPHRSTSLESALGNRDDPVRLHRPHAQHPDQHPGLPPHRGRLRRAYHRLRRSPSRFRLPGFNMVVWGFPAKPEHDEVTLRDRRTGKTLELPGVVRRRLHGPHPAADSDPAADQQSLGLHRRTADGDPRCPDLPGPRRNVATPRTHIPQPPTANSRPSGRSSTSTSPTTAPILRPASRSS